MSLILMVALVSLLIGLSKGGMGAVLAVLVTPLLSQVMDVQDAISLSLPLLMIGDAFALAAYWKKWDMHYIRLLLPMAVVGIVVGMALLASLPNNVLRPVLAGFTLFFVAYRLLDYRLKSLHYHPRRWHGYVAGAASGLGSALANTGAPPFIAYMLLQGVEPTVFVATITLFFAFVNAIKLPMLFAIGLLHFGDITGVLWAVPLIPLGVWAGRWMVDRLNKVAFERFMLVVLVIAALVLLKPA